MTGQIVNLNRARKAREKTAKRARADANAVKFGRTKAERAAQATEQEVAKTRLDGHKRDKPPEN
ncbi:MAG: DUF4169 family protein [Pseudomonadota bacterium]